MVSFDTTKKDAMLIGEIVKRGVVLAPNLSKLQAHMDITACHANGCPMDLECWLAADEFNFAHDFFGINRHINRETGGLDNCFLPRMRRRLL